MNCLAKGLIATSLGILISGCTSISKEGTAVREVRDATAVAACKDLGEVIANPPYFLPTDAINTLKNETAKRGGNTLLVTDFSIGPAKGKAYEC